MSEHPDPALELSSEEMRRLGYQVVDMLVAHFAHLREMPSTRLARPDEMARLIDAKLPEQPRPFDELLRELNDHVFAYMGLTTHPRFFAWVPSPSNFVSVLGDALASGYNAFLGNWLEAAGPSRIEEITLGWLRESCGLPDTAGGLFLSGGSMANLTGLAVARHVKLGDEGGDPRELAVAYCSDQTHSSLDRAFRLLGFAPRQLVRLASDSHFRLPMEELRCRVAADKEAGKLPFCVIANAGTTNTGAVDPLGELADFCRSEGLWLHVDGAYGAAAMLCEEGRRLLEGLGSADSLVIDPHKWLFQPYEIGCLLVRDVQQLRDAFRISAEYLSVVHRLVPEVIHFQDCGIQLTRSFRALKLWLSLNYFGLAAFRAAVRRGIELAQQAEQILRATPNFEVVTPAQLAIITFRYAPPGASLEAINAVNERIADRLLTQGDITMTTTSLRGRNVLRLCTINPRTTEQDLRVTMDRVAITARQIS